ncbi:BadF/BadG/BcrA/BcrD ATPase family protein [Saccharospirillum impatiens]|uniref:BadF/BadG/BcrA/BcrD ATPase family protein n=1 Tax=Saccharospirillum impatiens TaxID=169438 RepID=UPI00040BAA52|nr:BadF/BadG/BcrA/BcrD ATPase family protein [Saccharospirillum impatiens]
MKTADSAPLFMGIDGGGTSCRVRLADRQGHILAEARAGSANVYQSVETSWRSIDQATAEALHAAGFQPQDRSHVIVVAGLAGSEIDSAAAGFLQRPHGFAQFELLNDGQIACLGAHGGSDGVLLIVGTGVVGVSSQQGQWRQVSGWGFPLDDGGSGAWLGLQAVRHALWQRDGLVDASDLTQAVWALHDDSVSGLIGWAQQAQSVDYGKLAPLVMNWYDQADPIARQIVSAQLDILNRLLDVLMPMPQPLAVMGGLAARVSPLLAERHRSHLRTAQGDALDGALRLALARSPD